MYTIIPQLLAHIQVLNNQIKFLLTFIAKNIPLNSKPSDWNSPKYNKLKIDKLPIIKVTSNTNKNEFKKLLKDYQLAHGKPLKPISRQSKCSVPEHLHCPHCHAPSNYIYDHNGGKGQFRCKVCNKCFFENFKSTKTIDFRCPYCNTSLWLKRKRKNFNVHVCNNKKCSYFLDNLNSLSKEDLTLYNSDPSKFKLHYFYREFTTDFFKVDLYSLPKGASSLAFRKFSPHIMGLCLTYHVNCGLSTRKLVIFYVKFTMLKFLILKLQVTLLLLLIV